MHDLALTGGGLLRKTCAHMNVFRLGLFLALGMLAGCGDNGFNRMFSEPTPTPAPTPVATPTPKPGDWMWKDRPKGTLLDETPRKR